MTVSHDATTAHGTVNQTVVTFAHTVASQSDRLLLVAIAGVDASAFTISSVTYNGAALSAIYNTNPATGYRHAFFAMIAPDVGTHNVVVTFSLEVNEIGILASSYYNVDQADPYGTAQFASATGAGQAWASCAGFANGMAVGFCYRATTASIAQTVADVDGIPEFGLTGTATVATGVTSRTPAVPTGMQLGDAVFASCASENNATHSCSTSGWTKLGQTNSGAGWTVSHWMAVTDGALAAPVITWTGAADASARCWSMRDAKSSSPAAYLGTVGTGTGATHTSTGGNTTDADAHVLYVDHALANTALGAPSGWTEHFDAGNATGPYRLVVGGKDVASAGGASGNISVSGAAAAWVQQQIEVHNSDAGDQTNRGEVESGVDGWGCASLSTEAGQTYNQLGWAFTGGTTDRWMAGAVCLKAASAPAASPRFHAQLLAA